MLPLLRFFIGLQASESLGECDIYFGTGFLLMFLSFESLLLIQTKLVIYIQVIEAYIEFGNFQWSCRASYVVFSLAFQGLTLRFQARGLKRSFDKFNGISVSLYILFRAPSLKNLGAHSKI